MPTVYAVGLLYALKRESQYKDNQLVLGMHPPPRGFYRAQCFGVIIFIELTEGMGQVHLKSPSSNGISAQLPEAN